MMGIIEPLDRPLQNKIDHDHHLSNSSDQIVYYSKLPSLHRPKEDNQESIENTYINIENEGSKEPAKYPFQGSRFANYTVESSNDSFSVGNATFAQSGE